MHHLNPKYLIHLAVSPLILAYPIGNTGKAIAQIRADQTLPQPTVVRRVGNRHRIEQGTQAGRNLFHSFEAFSIPEGHTASFRNSPRIRNILSRVTGVSASRIQGVLETQGNSNLYLLNPNGILFGANAELRIGGSFLATTAESLTFENGMRFSATSPAASRLLSVTAPIGVQFGTRSGQIEVTGSGNQLFVDFPFIETASPPQTLEVAPTQTLALLGHEIAIDGGNLKAVDGHIELGAIGSTTVIPLSTTLRGDYRSVGRFGNIRLRNAASLDTSGQGSGSITLQGRQIKLSGGSTLLARTLNQGRGGGIFVNASESLNLEGFSEDALGPAFPTSLLTDVAVGAKGTGENIVLNTPRLRVLDGAFISAGTFDQGNAGNIKITADRIELIGDGPFGASGLFSDTFAPGSGGNIRLNTGSLLVADGAQISTSTLTGSPLGGGKGGSQTIFAREIELLGGSQNTGSSGLFANVETEQNGGAINITANRLSIENGAEIATTSFDSGTAGQILIHADQVRLLGASPNGIGSGIFSNAEASGTGGQIRLNGRTQSQVQQLKLSGGAQIASSTFDSGRAGSVSIEAQNIQLLGAQTPAGGTTGIITAVGPQASGQGGTVTIVGTQLIAQDGAQISAGTQGAGTAGDLRVNVETINLIGGDRAGRSGLFVSAIDSTGASGNLNVRAKDIVLDNGATINASNFASRGNESRPGVGPAGDIRVKAQTITLNNQSKITAATAAGDRGNINLTSGLLTLSESSQISTNAQGSAIGGNINLDHDFIFASGNSDITANAQQSFGGRVIIQAQGIFGTEERNQLTSASDITASSSLGPAFSGVIQINSPETDPSDSLVNLPVTLVNRTQQIQNTCRQNAGNSLVVAHRQSLTTQDFSSFSTAQSWFNRGQDSTGETSFRQPAPSEQNSFTLQEAQRWSLTANGRLKLLATPQASREHPLQSQGC